MPKTADQKADIRRFSIFLAGAFVILMGLAAAAIKNAPPPPPELPDLGHVPLFHLTDQKGQPYSESALGGRVWVANFIFTRCPEICPLFTQRMAKVQDQLSDLTDSTGATGATNSGATGSGASGASGSGASGTSGASGSGSSGASGASSTTAAPTTTTP